MAGSKKQRRGTLNADFDSVELSDERYTAFQEAGKFQERHKAAGSLVVSRFIFEVWGKDHKKLAAELADSAIKISSERGQLDLVIEPHILHRSSNGDKGNSIVYFTSEQIGQNNLEIATAFIMLVTNVALEFADVLPCPKST